MNSADQIITLFIESELADESFPSLDYSTDELKSASRRAATRDLNHVMRELDRIIAGRES